MRKAFSGILFGLLAFVLLSSSASAASISFGPTTGSFTVGSTFEVSIFIDTQGETINAFDLEIIFPPEKLQVVSPSTGQSIVSVWTAPPYFDNTRGILRFTGGVPNGINVSQGTVSKITFRVKQTGSATLKFADESRVLLNDGKGTDSLRDIQSAIFNFTLPPPAGPIVASETHPNQNAWYSRSTVVLQWGQDQEAEGYSHMISSNPVDIPDNISEGPDKSVAYRNIGDGVQYFHIKALRGGVWGGVTHFGINIDTTPPAEFPIKISPNKRTTNKNPVITFETTDASSGISYYEYKVVPLDLDGGEKITPFFVETNGNEILTLDIGSYHVIARAYDKAGNVQEVTQELKVVTPIFQPISNDGIRISGGLTLSWVWLFVIGAVIIAILAFLAFKIWRWRQDVEEKRDAKTLPDDVKGKLEELRKYRQKYGNMTAAILLAILFFFAQAAYAQQLEITPPYISIVSRNISNEEIFYVGGKTDVADANVIIYLQNLSTGETFSQVTRSDKNSDWFYRHNSFLPPGEYLVWAQTKVGEQISPPGPQIQLVVNQTAIQFGSSRFSFETIYLIATVILMLLVVVLAAFIVHNFRHVRRYRAAFNKEIREAEEAVRRGFAVLKRDIQAQLELIKKARLSKGLSEQEEKLEAQLLKDLTWVENYIGKEIWDVEKLDIT